MKQFDIFENPEETSRAFAPYLVLISSHLIDLDAVTVAPLLRDRALVNKGLELRIPLHDQDFVLSIVNMLSLAPNRLRRRAGSLESYEGDIRRCIDRLFTGF